MAALVLLAGTGLSGLTPAAHAANSYLCTGYTSCQQAGYPHHGYKKASDQMWWRMYAGHNCTNYVAYRFVKRGFSAERPWDGTGMAYNWGPANRHLLDDTPMVGAVAWWNRNTGGVGSSGHVAYVEQVVSATKIVVSEDSWGGDFHWRVITKDSGRWPTGFIHFMDEAVSVVDPPEITGDAAVGRTLSADTGSWSPTATQQLEWLAAGEPIPGATGTTLTLTPELRGVRIKLRVTATQRGYVDGEARTSATSRVSRGTLAVAAAPAIAGTARVDEVLELVPGAWSPAPDSTSVQWLADGEPIPGATGTRLRVGQQLIGQQITVTTTARREAYFASPVTSQPTARVQAGRFEITEPFAVRGRLKAGRTLHVVPGVVEPADANVTYTWLRDGVAVGEGTSYLLAVEDVGHRMSLQVDLRRTGYRDRTVVVPVDGAVATKPDLTIRATGRPGRAVVRLLVTAPGVDAPAGRATIKVGGVEETGQVRDGVLRVVVRGLRPGERTIRVRYTGAGVVLPARARSLVDIPG